MPHKKLLIVAFVFIALVKGLMWSISTPYLRGPDEQPHFIHAKIMVEKNTYPKNQHYYLPLNIEKSVAVSHSSWVYTYQEPRLLHDGKSAPFEERVDEPITIDEAQKIFIDLPPWDIEPLSIPWKLAEEDREGYNSWDIEEVETRGGEPSDIERSDTAVSFNLSLLKSLYIRNNNLLNEQFNDYPEVVYYEFKNFILYGRKAREAQRGGIALNKTSALLFVDGKFSNLIAPHPYLNEPPDVTISDDGVVTFKKEPGELVSFRVIPIGRDVKAYYTISYSFPPPYYSALYGIIKVVDKLGGGIISEVFFGRLFSVLIGVMILYFFYNTYRIIWPEHEEYAFAGMALFTFWPMMSYVFAAATPDVFLDFFSAGAFYFLFRLLFKDDNSTKDWALLALFASVATITKVNAILIITIWWVLLVALLKLVRKRKISLKWFYPPTLLVFGPYMFWYRIYGFSPDSQMLRKKITFIEYLKYQFDIGFNLFYESFVGLFRMNHLPQSALNLILIFIVTMIALFAYGIFKGFKKERRIDFLFIFLGTFFSVSFFFLMTIIQGGKYGLVFGGRYLFFLALPMTLVIWGAAVEQSGRRVKAFAKTLAYAFVIALILINCYGMYDFVLENFYIAQRYTY